MTNDDIAALLKLQKDCGIPHSPTQLTYELRLAVSGQGERAYDWSDKPHRLLYDACCEIERLTSERAGQQSAEARVKALEAALLEIAEDASDYFETWIDHGCEGKVAIRFANEVVTMARAALAGDV